MTQQSMMENEYGKSGQLILFYFASFKFWNKHRCIAYGAHFVVLCDTHKL